MLSGTAPFTKGDLVYFSLASAVPGGLMSLAAEIRPPCVGGRDVICLNTSFVGGLIGISE